MFKWFKNCSSIEDVKKTYRKLALKYHPDLTGGTTESEMKEINAEYEIAFRRFKNIHSKAESNSETNQSSDNTDSNTSEYSDAETPEMFKDIIDGLIHCDGVQIDIVGSWVWLTGNTFEYKDTIKGLGFKWASKKKAWYWHSGEFTKRRHSKMSLDDIKNKYGCQSFKGKANLRLA